MQKDLAGKTILVTGATSGIGKVTAEALAARGARVWLACRSEEKTRPVIDAIRKAGGDARFVPLDLGDLASVRATAETFLASGDPLHVLINNAGVASIPGLTKDGFELAFGTNHVGHFLLTELLLPRLRESAPSRIVNVASEAHYQARELDWDAVRRPTQTTVGMKEYAVSKLANVLHARGLAKRLAGSGITTYALHPGVVATDIWRRIPRPIAWVMKRFMLSEEEGAETTLHCATDEGAGAQTGLYYEQAKEKTPSPLALDDALVEELWQRTEAWVAPFRE